MNVENRDNPRWRVPLTINPATGVALVIVSVALLLARSLSIGVPILMGDEYYYIKTSQLWALQQEATRVIASLPGRGIADFPNSLFFAVFSQVFRFGDDFYVAAKVLIAGLTSLMAGMVFLTSAMLEGAAKKIALWLAVLVLWMPSTTYLPYFMPEALHDLLIWTGIALYVAILPRKPLLAVALFGSALGAAFLSKPNALAFLAIACVGHAIVVLVHADVANRVSRTFVEVAAMCLSFVLAGFLLNAASTGHWTWKLFGSFYQNSLARMTEVSAERSFANTFGDYLFAYLGTVVAFCAVPLIAIATGWRAGLQSIRSTAVLSLGVVGAAVLVLASAKVSTNWERVFAHHSGVYTTRYIHVVYPLLLMGGAICLERAAANLRGRRLVGVFVALFMLAFFVAYRSMENALQMRDIHWVIYTGHTGGTAWFITGAAFIAATVWYAMGSRADSRPYIVLLCVNAAAACLALTAFDRTQSRQGQSRHLSEAAHYVRNAVGQQSWDSGLVVTPPFRREASLFMASFPGFVPIAADSGTDPYSLEQVPARTNWVVFVGRIPPVVGMSCTDLPGARFCRLPQNLATSSK